MSVRQEARRRRLVARYPLSLAVSVRAKGLPSTSCPARNVSVGGLFLSSDTRPELFSELQLTFTLPNGRNVTLGARVVHVLAGQKARELNVAPGFGVQFGVLDQLQRSALHELVAWARARDPRPRIARVVAGAARDVLQQDPMLSFLLDQVDGQRDPEALAEELALDVEMVERMLSELQKRGAVELRSARELGGMHPATIVPPPMAASASAAPARSPMPAELARELVELESRLPTADHYQLLGLDRGASAEEIRTAFQARDNSLHPSLRPPAEAQRLEIVLGRVREAYSALSSPERRAEYDEYLRRRQWLSAAEARISIRPPPPDSWEEEEVRIPRHDRVLSTRDVESTAPATRPPPAARSSRAQASAPEATSGAPSRGSASPSAAPSRASVSRAARSEEQSPGSFSPRAAASGAPARASVSPSDGASGAPARGSLSSDAAASGAPVRASVSPSAAASGSPARASVSPSAAASGAPARASVSPSAAASGAPARGSLSSDAAASGSPARASVSPSAAASGAPSRGASDGAASGSPARASVSPSAAASGAPSGASPTRPPPSGSGHPRSARPRASNAPRRGVRTRPPSEDLSDMAKAYAVSAEASRPVRPSQPPTARMSRPSPSELPRSGAPSRPPPADSTAARLSVPSRPPPADSAAARSGAPSRPPPVDSATARSGAPTVPPPRVSRPPLSAAARLSRPSAEPKLGAAGQILMQAEAAFAAGNTAEVTRHLKLLSAMTFDDARVQTRFVELKNQVYRTVAVDFEKQAAYEEKQQHWSLAAQSWLRVAEGRPNDSMPLQRAALAQLQAGVELRIVMETAKRAVEVGPNEAEAHRVMAKVYVAADMQANARRELEAAQRCSRAAGDDDLSPTALLKRLLGREDKD